MGKIILGNKLAESFNFVVVPIVALLMRQLTEMGVKIKT